MWYYPFLIGDSTLADKNSGRIPEKGWGQVLPLYFSKGIRVENLKKGLTGIN